MLSSIILLLYILHAHMQYRFVYSFILFRDANKHPFWNALIFLNLDVYAINVIFKMQL